VKSKKPICDGVITTNKFRSEYQAAWQPLLYFSVPVCGAIFQQPGPVRKKKKDSANKGDQYQMFMPKLKIREMSIFENKTANQVFFFCYGGWKWEMPSQSIIPMSNIVIN